MILAGKTIKRLGLIEPCLPKGREFGMSYGLGNAGYDIRMDIESVTGTKELWLFAKEFRMIGTIEKVNLSTEHVGQIHVKSSWTRQGITTLGMPAIDPGFRGHLTLGVINHSNETVVLNHGQAIAQVMFTWTDVPTEEYDGKYQDQAAGVTEAKDYD